MEQRINQMALSRGAYRPQAYFFTLEAVGATVRDLPVRRHLSGKELLHGIVRLLHHHYPDDALSVLGGWGINTTRDFGVIVYDLIEGGVLSRSPDDELEDFVDVFDLGEALNEEAWRQRWRIGGWGPAGWKPGEIT